MQTTCNHLAQVMSCSLYYIAQLHMLILLQAVLLDSFYGTDRGLTVTSEARAEISELITQLEAKNPTPAPTEVRTLAMMYQCNTCFVQTHALA